MKTSGDNHYSLSKIHKIFISLSVFLRKIWFWHCQKQNCEYYESLHPLYSNVTCNMSQSYKYRNHPRSLLSHASFLSQIVALHSAHEFGDILFVSKKCFYGAKIHFTKCLSIFLVYHMPGTLPSLPFFPYLDSTHKNESNCIYYIVVGAVVFKSIWPSPVPGLVAVAEIGCLSPVPCTI